MLLPVRTLQDLYARSGASRWDVSLDAFGQRLDAIVARECSGESGTRRDVEAFARSLHVEDLALACACAAGHEAAWDHFVRELRPALYAAARSIAPSGAAQELADSLYAELFGLDTRSGVRRSLLDYYHGRARLSTWLRTVLAQRHVDGLRSSSRMVPLEEEGDVARRAEPVESADLQPHRQERVVLVQRALDAAIVALDARDRLRLRLYYGEGLRLAQIGRLLREHEATVSRKLERARRDIRRHIERTLVHDHRLAPEAVRECLEMAAGAPEIDVSRALADDT
jgi:RNA polymerase sigma-70 factor (ECF subfamily)